MRWTVVLLGCVSGACATAPALQPNGPVPLARGSIDAFSPLVAGSTAARFCEDRTGDHLEDGERAVAFVYPEPPSRQVTVTLDAAGHPIRYMDVRGDLSLDGRSGGDRTTIGLYLTADYAVLSNRPENGEPVILEVPLSQALRSERLGDPSRTLEDVLTTCV